LLSPKPPPPSPTDLSCGRVVQCLTPTPLSAVQQSEPLNTSSGILKAAEQRLPRLQDNCLDNRSRVSLQSGTTNPTCRVQQLSSVSADTTAQTGPTSANAQFRLSATSLPRDVPSGPLCYTPSVGVCVVCLDYCHYDAFIFATYLVFLACSNDITDWFTCEIE